MDGWKDLVKIMLLGSGSALNAEKRLKKELEHLGWTQQNSRASIESSLLEVTAVYSMFRSAGMTITQERQELPYVVAEEEQLEKCSPLASGYLNQILQNNQDEILAEWLLKIKSLNKRVPEELLPDLLTFGARYERLVEKIIPVLGKRGQWLAQFNKRWAFAKESISTENNEEAYYLGKLEVRLLHIQRLRSQKLNAARDLLLETWNTEDYQTKVAFLKLFYINLSEEDLPFLEMALDDRRKEVRKEAAVLLANLPSSSLVKRFEVLLQDFIQYDKIKNQLQVELPTQLNKALRRDGIQEHYRPLPEGKKANWLAQMIAILPPSFWQKHWDLSIQECLDLAIQNDYKNLWWWAWGTAAKRLGDEAWLLAMHRYIMEHKLSEKKKLNFSLDFLYNDLSNKLFNQLVLEYLEQTNHSFISDDDPAMLLLLQEHQCWNDALAIEVISRIRKGIANDAGVFNWNQKTLLKRAAFAVHPNLYGVLEEGWPEELGYSWQSEVHNFLATLRFRRNIMDLKA